MTWREIERELIDFFEREGVAVKNNSGDHWVEIPAKFSWYSSSSFSLTRLAHRLTECAW
jgi:hypothetical protein